MAAQSHKMNKPLNTHANSSPYMIWCPVTEPSALPEASMAIAEHFGARAATIERQQAIILSVREIFHATCSKRHTDSASARLSVLRSNFEADTHLWQEKPTVSLAFSRLAAIRNPYTTSASNERVIVASPRVDKHSRAAFPAIALRLTARAAIEELCQQMLRPLPDAQLIKGPYIPLAVMNNEAPTQTLLDQAVPLLAGLGSVALDPYKISVIT